MRLLADENLELPIVQALREKGHTVLLARSGTPDEEVLRSALQEDCILLTNDKDFAELTFLQRRASAGIILLHLPRLRTREKALEVVKVVDDLGDSLVGRIAVIEADATRVRPLPGLVERS
ncbi:MAG TPA: DUF5615 family PIN-like protein [Thermoanaerobaculia bacterium]|jgi:predicted nuclease of predicted toxin-antitoxin system